MVISADTDLSAARMTEFICKGMEYLYIFFLAGKHLRRAQLADAF